MSTVRTARRRILSFAISAALFGAFLVGGAGSAAAAGLFEAASANDMRAVSPAVKSPRIIRDRLVRLDANELANHVAPLAADNAPDRVQRATRLDGVVTIELFPNLRVVVRRTDVEAPPEGGYIWSGQSNSGQPGWTTLVINDNQITGNVQIGSRLFSIEPVSGALHRVIELDPNKIPRDIHPPAIPQRFLNKSDAEAPAQEGVTPAAVTTIDVFVAYTRNARIEIGNATKMLAQINLAIKLANTAYANSGVSIRLRRVGTPLEVNYNEATQYGGLNTSRNYTAVLCDLTGFNCGSFGWNPPVANNNTTAFNDVRSRRQTFRADLVVLMRKQGAACGIAWVPDPPTAGTQDQGFSVVTVSPSYGCINGNTLAHELGHNQGLHHDRYVEPAAPNTKYNYGYVNTAGRFRTIMSYPDLCNASGISCTRIPYFSTPLKRYNNRPMGIARGRPGAADAARRLNETRNTIRLYR